VESVAVSTETIPTTPSTKSTLQKRKKGPSLQRG
jgi:hypothetical protein